MWKIVSCDTSIADVIVQPVQGAGHRATLHTHILPTADGTLIPSQIGAECRLRNPQTVA